MKVPPCHLDTFPIHHPVTCIRSPLRFDPEALYYSLIDVARNAEAVVRSLVHRFRTAENKHARNVLENSDDRISGPAR